MQRYLCLSNQGIRNSLLRTKDMWPEMKHVMNHGRREASQPTTPPPKEAMASICAVARYSRHNDGCEWTGYACTHRQWDGSLGPRLTGKRSLDPVVTDRPTRHFLFIYCNISIYHFLASAIIYYIQSNLFFGVYSNFCWHIFAAS